MNYSSNIILKNQYTDIQTVYASQIYGTFFGVFAAFHVEDIPDNSIERLLTQVDFYLINYKGPMNVELQSNIEKPEKVSTYDYNGYRFNLKVQHTPTAKAYQSIVPIDLKGFFPTEGGIKFKEKDFFIVQRQTIPLAGEDSDTNNTANAFVNGVFDSEFYIRDGAFGIPKNKIDYLSDDNLMFAPPPGSLGNDSCTPANNNIIF